MSKDDDGDLTSEKRGSHPCAPSAVTPSRTGNQSVFHSTAGTHQIQTPSLPSRTPPSLPPAGPPPRSTPDFTIRSPIQRPPRRTPAPTSTDALSPLHLFDPPPTALSQIRRFDRLFCCPRSHPARDYSWLHSGFVEPLKTIQPYYGEFQREARSLHR
jgi:hypothetical protein